MFFGVGGMTFARADSKTELGFILDGLFHLLDCFFEILIDELDSCTLFDPSDFGWL